RRCDGARGRPGAARVRRDGPAATWERPGEPAGSPGRSAVSPAGAGPRGARRPAGRSEGALEGDRHVVAAEAERVVQRRGGTVGDLARLVPDDVQVGLVVEV